MEGEVSNDNQQSYESSLSGHAGGLPSVWPQTFSYHLDDSASMATNPNYSDACEVQCLPSFTSNNPVTVLRSSSIPSFPLLSQNYPQERLSPTISYEQASYPVIQQPIARRHLALTSTAFNADEEQQHSSEIERPAISPNIPSLSHTTSSELLDEKNPFELVEQNGADSSKPRGMMNGNRRRGAPPALQLGSNRLGATVPNPMPSPAEMRRTSTSALTHRISKNRTLSGQRSPSIAQVEQMKQWAASRAQGPSHTLHPPPTPLTPYDSTYLLSSTGDHFPDLGTPASSVSEGFGSMNAPMPPMSASLPPHFLPLTSPPITPHTNMLQTHFNATYFTPPQSAPATKTHFAAMAGENSMMSNSYMNNDHASRRPSLPFNHFSDDGMAGNPTVSMAQLSNLNAPVDNAMMQGLTPTATNGLAEQQAEHQHQNWFGTSMAMSSEALDVNANHSMSYISSDMSDHRLQSRNGSLAETCTSTTPSVEVSEQNGIGQGAMMDSTQFIVFDPKAARAERACKTQKTEELRFFNSHPSSFIGSR